MCLRVFLKKWELNVTKSNNQIALCTIGSVFEWYEFMVFALLTPIISSLFFSKSDHLTAMLFTFAIFASGYLMRPIGAFFFGHLGDTLGRKRTLMLTLLLMTTSTFAMGCIPVGHTYSAIILLLCRLLQGFSASGEYPAALALLSEQAHPKRKGLVSSIAVFGTGFGCVLGAIASTILFHLLGHQGMMNGGWRILFLIAAPMGIISFLLRKKMLESPAFQSLLLQNKLFKKPIQALFQSHLKTLLKMLAISILANVIIYVNLQYINNYLLMVHKITTKEFFNIYLYSSVVYTFSILLFGFLSDYFDRKKLLIIACVLILIASYPIFFFIFKGSFEVQIIAQGILSALSGMILGFFTSLLADNFPTAVRYTGLSITINFAGSLFGGTAPIICGWITSDTHNILSSAFYVMFLAIVALIAVCLISHKKGQHATLTEI
jgi:MHS family proline/betaine transporter-like MFS transporter